MESVQPTESNEPRPPRQRPHTGESGASSSSATPSLKSVEQSSQDSVNSSDGEGSDPDFHLKSCFLLHFPKTSAIFTILMVVYFEMEARKVNTYTKMSGRRSRNPGKKTNVQNSSPEAFVSQ